MAATITDFGGRFRRYVETGTANAILTVTVAPGVPFRVLTVTTAYSGSPTQAGVTVTLDSGAGAGYDATLSTGSANTRYTTYQPSEPLVLVGDDAVVVAAPAGGGSLTSSTVVVVELL